jgi:CheY-like chemotaxis protein
VPARLIGDDMRLRQILLNLLSNAVKFTSAGRVEITLDLEGEPAPGQVDLRLCVTDSGIGIAPERQQAIFEPFEQAHVSTTRAFGGTGLGLAIARRIALLMNGRIELQSSLGQGSTFCLHWRATLAQAGHSSEQGLVGRAQRESAPAGLPDAAQGARPNPALRVLVAEDNLVNSTLIRLVLEREGIEPVVVADGAAALEQIRAQTFDLILMDSQMPLMEGLTVTRQLRQLALDPQPMVVAITANVFSEDRKACLEAGMDDFLAKPFRLEDLRRILTGLRPVMGAGLA